MLGLARSAVLLFALALGARAALAQITPPPPPPSAAATIVSERQREALRHRQADELVQAGDQLLDRGNRVGALDNYERALPLVGDDEQRYIDVQLRIALSKARLGDCFGASAALGDVEYRLYSDTSEEARRQSQVSLVRNMCGRP